MTVNSAINRVEYAGDGVSLAFAVGFYFLVDADLKVYLRDADDNETLLTITTHYTVTDAGNPAGGSVTMLTPPASGEKLVITRDPALTQLTDYQANDAFPAETHERALDKLTMITQRLNERFGFTLLLPETSATSDLTMPEPVADGVLKYNGDATDLEAVALAVLEPNVDTILGGLADNDLLVYDTGKWRNKPNLSWTAGVTIASSATTDVLGASSPFVTVSGTGTITSLGTGANRLRIIRFSGAATLTHNATSLILPGGANIVTANGDTMLIASDASSNARVITYQKASGAGLDAEKGKFRAADNGSVTTAQTVEENDEYQQEFTLAGDVTITFNNPTSGQGYCKLVRIVQDGTGGRSPTFQDQSAGGMTELNVFPTWSGRPANAWDLVAVLREESGVLLGTHLAGST